MRLRYGMNPQQAASAEPVTPGAYPVRMVHGQPSLINLLDALNAWQLAREADRLLGRPAAASFKHTSPAGAAVSGPLDEPAAGASGASGPGRGGPGVSAVASAYLRARDADPKSSYGDFAAVSRPVDDDLAALLAGVVSDGIIAPGYAPGTVGRLSAKKNGRFLIMEADPAFTPPREESREVFGMRLTQRRDPTPLSRDLLRVVVGPAGTGPVGIGPVEAGLVPVPPLPLPDDAADDLLLGLVVLRYTQSNSVCYTRGGMTLGIGAGQQSRVDCTRLAGAKADTWWLRRHPAIAGLRFAPGVSRQDMINWRIRLTEGDLTAGEQERLRSVLADPDAPADPDGPVDSAPAIGQTSGQTTGQPALSPDQRVAPASGQPAGLSLEQRVAPASGRRAALSLDQGTAPGTGRRPALSPDQGTAPGSGRLAGLTPEQRAAWLSRRTGVAFASDGYLPFRDNVDHAHRHGVSYIAEPGGSVHSDEVAEACRQHGITLARTGLRLFHH